MAAQVTDGLHSHACFPDFNNISNCMHMCVGMNRIAHGGQKYALNPMEVVVSCMTWILEPKFKSSRRAIYALNYSAVPAAPKVVLLFPFLDALFYS